MAAHPSGPIVPWPRTVPPAEMPDVPVSLLADVRVFVGEHRARLVRLGLHLVVAALPLLAISAHVFGIAPMNVTAGLVVVPLTLVALLLGVFSPSGEERLLLAGAMWGVLATLVYDAVRLDTVYLLGWWGDFIPRVGTWILDAGPEPGAGASVGGAVVGYLWRYVGDGGGIGVAFFVLVAATGLRRWGEHATVAASVVFAVFPVWTGLIATVALAPRGQQQMFPLTPATVILSLVGHLVFGLVLGLGCARCRRLEEYWPWTPLLDLRRGAPAPAVPSPGGGGWGPPALVTAGGDDPEVTEIRTEVPPRSRGRRAVGTASRPLSPGPTSGPVRVLDMPPPRSTASGPVPLAPRVGRRPRSGPVPMAGPPTAGPLTSGPLTSGPLTSGPLTSGPLTSGPRRPGASGPVPMAGPPSAPARPATGPWPHPAGVGADPWRGPDGRRATSSAKAPPGGAGRG